KPLYVSSLLIGEQHTGKRTFIQSLFPNSVYVDAENELELETALESNSELVIYNFEKVTTIKNLNFENKKIIAIANTTHKRQEYSDVFAFIYNMPNLREREDLTLLISHFQKQVEKALMIEESTPILKEKLDLSQNIKSLKASIYKELIIKTFDEEDIKGLLYDYLFSTVKGNNAYREHLGLYEIPLIEAGLKKYKSQLKLANVLGLNRNTLRKKIQEYDIH
ncbi:MAG TPA: Fis family transcriptional regulator, partial [Campylobacterales bacterium]|nr:Fis family transcriptional regulator [Campylobacterales bacterium]